MNLFDWIAVALVALLAVAGYFRGLLTAALSLAGIVGGALLGARLAPSLPLRGGAVPALHAARRTSAGDLLRDRARGLGSYLGSGCAPRCGSSRSAVDSPAGGLVGAATGLAVVWVVGTVVLLIPGRTSLRRNAQRSVIVRQLNDILPPSTVSHALARIDPLLAIEGPLALGPPPSPAVLDRPGSARGRAERRAGCWAGLRARDRRERMDREALPGGHGRHASSPASIDDRPGARLGTPLDAQA